ncbi:FecR protein [Planctomycetes bacterium Pan216]|uniref:FecR protein n=1 Tax=Kolteria novifilia TaxID=2527975 RepID=A0A518B2M9_9BACT|nr:FecR protein [Planctomycetes bacterium Pan216]
MGSLDARRRAELDALIEDLCRGAVDAEGMVRLDSLLRDDSEAQRYYLHQIDLHHSLRWELTSRLTHRSLATIKQEGLQPVPVSPASDGDSEFPASDGNSEFPASDGDSEFPASDGDSEFPASDGDARRDRFRWVAALAAGLVLAIALSWPRGDTRSPAPRERHSLAKATPVLKKESIPSRQVATHGLEDVFPVTPTWAELVAAEEVTWKGPAIKVGTRVGAEAIDIANGRVRLRLDDGSVVSLEGPARFRLLETGRGRLRAGTLATALGDGDQRFTIETPNVEFRDLGAEIGIHVSPSGTRATVFRGEVEAVVSSELLGVDEVLRLSRRDGLAVDTNGILTSAIMGDGRRYRGVRDYLNLAKSKLANGSFEYPHSVDGTLLAAAGWTLMAHPVANAEGMTIDAGVLPSGLPRPRGTTIPKAPKGRQWAYLAAKTFADGRNTYTSMHQAVGAMEAGVTYRIALKVAQPKAPEPARHDGGYTIGLYAGSIESGPTTPLRVWRSLSLPDLGQTIAVGLDYQTPEQLPYEDGELFVMIQAVPGTAPGDVEVLVDDITLTVTPPAAK